MKLVYIVSMFIIILIALISPRKEYFNLTEPCYKNLGNKNSYGSELTDILSNGFKQRGTGVSMNASGGTYVYAAFAEAPFKYVNAR